MESITAFPNPKIPQTKMATKVVALVWLGHLPPQKHSKGAQTCTWGLQNRKNNKCNFTRHYSILTATMGQSVINSISPKNKDKH